MDAFRRALSIASEIWLVGKNFMNADRELNGVVRWATSDRERVLSVIDPHLDIAFHLRLFNARLGSRYATLEELFECRSRERQQSMSKSRAPRAGEGGESPGNRFDGG